jgi:hypothetical protein
VKHYHKLHGTGIPLAFKSLDAEEYRPPVLTTPCPLPCGDAIVYERQRGLENLRRISTLYPFKSPLYVIKCRKNQSSLRFNFTRVISCEISASHNGVLKD